MKLAVDTNILVYAEGLNGPERQARAIDLISRLPTEARLVPVQVLGELFNVLVRKAARSRTDARSAILTWRDTFMPIETTIEVLLIALDLAADHKLAAWDSVILAAASIAGCTILLSEDMQNGFSWGGVTVIDPFTSPFHPLLMAALNEQH